MKDDGPKPPAPKGAREEKLAAGAAFLRRRLARSAAAPPKPRKPHG